MTALVLSETVTGGRKAGFLVSLAPFISDIPIVLVIMFFYSQIAKLGWFIPTISFIGSLFLIYIGLKQLRMNLGDIEVSGRHAKGAFKRGLLVNLLNPHPYIFWIMIGAPTLIKAYEASFSYATAFYISMYVCLVGGKMSMTLLIDGAAGRLSGKYLTLISRFMAFLLIAFGFSLLYDGFDFAMKAMK